MLDTAHGPIRFPSYLPDATRAAVRCVGSADLEAVGVETLMVNAFHLMIRPGIRRIQRLGGLHAFMGWRGPIVTDSGGFQVLSLIRENPKNGTIRPDGPLFRAEGKKIHLTPEKCVQAQLQLGTDVVIALDDCTDPASPHADQVESVERTLLWTRRCREELERQIDQGQARRPLVGVVQGGDDPELRTACAAGLTEIGVDAYGFGGWPITAEGELRTELFALLHSLVPAGVPVFALGVGKPEHLVALTDLGLAPIFDCALPTRDARHGRLFADDDDALYRWLYIRDEVHGSDPRPISATCDCPCCSRYSRAYLHHLFKVKDGQAERLATLHNLRFYVRLIDRLRA